MAEAGILLEFARVNDGEWRSYLPGWNEETPVCDWGSIECTSGVVTALDLASLGIEGTIPETLGRISTLESLVLNDNHFLGTFPSFLTSAASKIIEIDLSNNELQGLIPKISNRNLIYVNLAHNQFSGTLHESLGKELINLKAFDVRNNGIKGSIPISIGDMVDIHTINLSNNLFTGKIPDSLGGLKHLQQLYLNNNNLSGTIPSSLTQDDILLEKLGLHGNYLSGTLPAALADLKLLKSLLIDNNKFTGTIPSNLCNRNLNSDLFQGMFSHEHFIAGDIKTENMWSEVDWSDKFPESLDPDLIPRDIDPDENPGNSDHLNRQRFLLSSNQDCASIACPPKTRGEKTSSMGGFSPCIACDDNEDNPFLGSNKCFSLNQNEILKLFYAATDGEKWDTQSTWRMDNIPTCEKRGITCDSAGNILEIHLAGLDISGTIPPAVGFLKYLRVLNLADNQFTGNLPLELKFPPLLQLDVSGNMLAGSIPQGLCEKSELNKNGEGGQFDCDIIVCAVQTYSASGHSEPNNLCLPCSGSRYLGSKHCNSKIGWVQTPSLGVTARTGLAALGIFTITCLLYLYVKMKQTKLYASLQGVGQDGLTLSDEYTNTAYASKSVPLPNDPTQDGTFPLDDEEQIEYDSDGNNLWLDVPGDSTSSSSRSHRSGKKRGESKSHRSGRRRRESKSKRKGEFMIDVPQLD